MSVVPVVRRLGGAAASLALVGGVALATTAPSVAAADHPPLTVSKTVAHSGLDHGDEIDESGGECIDSELSTGVIMWLAKGVVSDDQPIDTDLVGTGNAALPDASGNWSGGFSVSGGSPDLVIPPGTYTLRTECDAGGELKFIYAGVQITITSGDADDSTTTTASDGSTTTTAAGSTSTTAASTTTATKADPVSAAATFTG